MKSKRRIETISVEDLYKDPNGVFTRLHTTKKPSLIMQKEKEVAIILSVEAFEQSERERELLWIMTRGENEIAAGDGVRMQGVFDEADVILAM